MEEEKESNKKKTNIFLFLQASAASSLGLGMIDELVSSFLFFSFEATKELLRCSHHLFGVYPGEVGAYDRSDAGGEARVQKKQKTGPEDRFHDGFLQNSRYQVMSRLHAMFKMLVVEGKCVCFSHMEWIFVSTDGEMTWKM